ncbi:MAG: hypothetical protein KJ645_02500 [Planctomycetes bacterium]|nr:hypothetical protein [Planctomycetota bacterium]
MECRITYNRVQCDRIRPGYERIKRVRFGWRYMSARDRLNHQAEYEKANNDETTYIRSWSNGKQYGRLVEKLNQARWHRSWLVGQLADRLAAQPSLMLEDIPYTRTKRSRTCKVIRGTSFLNG